MFNVVLKLWLFLFYLLYLFIIDMSILYMYCIYNRSDNKVGFGQYGDVHHCNEQQQQL